MYSSASKGIEMAMQLKVIALLAVVFASTSAWADDIFPPDWRTDPPGQGFTTLQSWEFGTDDNPTAPDEDFNFFGDPLATVIGDSPFADWLDEDRGHFGAWRIEDWMQLDIPNNPEPNDVKHVWVQVTYSASNGSNPEILSLPGYSSIVLVEKTQLDDSYWHGTWDITIEPNPDSETLVLMPRDCTLYVDEVVVDTICIPEPAGLMMLAVLGLASRRR